MGTIKRKSFTLIELIIAVGVVALILPPIFDIFFTMIRQQLVLISYQEMKQQGDSIQRNVRNILQNRAAHVTDGSYATVDICPPITTPTPTYSPILYINDRDGTHIKLYQEATAPNRIASDSGVTKTYYLTTQNVVVTDLEFTCHRINEFTPAIVSTTYTVGKSSAFGKSISLPYTFNVKLRNY